MTTNAYLIYWCEEGLESVIPITKYEQWDRDNTFRILNNEDPVRRSLLVRALNLFEYLGYR